MYSSVPPLRFAGTGGSSRRLMPEDAVRKYNVGHFVAKWGSGDIYVQGMLTFRKYYVQELFVSQSYSRSGDIYF